MLGEQCGWSHVRKRGAVGYEAREARMGLHLGRQSCGTSEAIVGTSAFTLSENESHCRILSIVVTVMRSNCAGQG